MEAKLSRRSGRPDAQASEALDHHILATACRLFIAKGYAATSVEQIATAIGAGKQTIYRRYPSKEALFEAVIGELADLLIDGAASAEKSSSDPLAALHEACRRLLDFVSKPDAVGVYRILIAESQRFPALIDRAMDRASEPFHTILKRLLKAARETGQIAADGDDEETSRALSGLLTGWALQQALMGRPGLADDAERAVFFRNAWTLFLRGVSPP